MLDTHERAITGSEQKLRFDQGAEQSATRCRIEPPQAARLRFRESQSRHFEELSLDPPEHFLQRMILLGRHLGTPCLGLERSDPGATDMPPTVVNRVIKCRAETRKQA
jgi:hypothetical protein